MAPRLFIRTTLLSLKNIMANKGQNTLSVITVILGALTISTVFTINDNVDRYIEHLISKNGGANLFVSTMYNNIAFTDSDLNQLSSLSSARYSIYDSEIEISYRVGADKYKNTSAILWQNNYKLARPITILSGQFFGSIDLMNPRNNVVINEEIADSFAPASPIGKSLLLSNAVDNFVVKIIGVARAEYDQERRAKLWLTQNSFDQLNGSKERRNLIVGTNSFEYLDDFQFRVESHLQQAFPGGIDIYNPRVYFDKLKAEYETFIHTGAIIGFLALIGGTLGVLNLMLMGIKLRTREIGLYRALGFPTLTVLQIFLMESILTVAIGGAIGAGIGCFVGYTIANQIVTIPPIISIESFLASFLATLIVGLIFSYLPAIRASKIQVVKALRS